MKVFVAGGSGAIGAQLVPQLVDAGHDVVVMTRSESKRPEIRALGASAVVADALDAEQVAVAVAQAEPEVIVHQVTAIGTVNMRKFDRDFALTNRLRREGTDHLLSAGQAVGISKFVAQSYCVWPYARSGGAVKNEDDPLDADPAPQMRQSLAALRHLEEAVTGATWTTGIVLRYGAFYGPGTALNRGGEQFEMVLQGKFPLVGDGGGVWSFVHIADAARATLAAIDRGRRGIYNISDDDPATVAQWLPELAKTLGAKPPRKVPKLVGRLLAGEAAAVMMTEIRGASNRKARTELGWQPEYASWRRGFVESA